MMEGNKENESRSDHTAPAYLLLSQELLSKQMNRHPHPPLLRVQKIRCDPRQNFFLKNSGFDID